MQNNSTFQKYLTQRLKYPPFISSPPSPTLSVVITIPLFDEPDVLPTLNSIYQDAPSDDSFEVLAIVNHSETSSRSIKDQSRSTISVLRKWKEAKEVKNFHVIELLDVPDKLAGVGHARKTVMDEALVRLLATGKYDGIIACTDGDTVVGKDYVKALADLVENDWNGSAAYSFAFEHRIDGLPDWQLEAIMRYELHLRYFSRCHDIMGHPHWIFTVGSAMACRVTGYVEQGGMNERKAGEDFYFLQKFAKADRLIYHPEVAVYPSARPSDRVPFGTGKAVGDFGLTGNLDTYSFDSVLRVGEWIRKIMLWYDGKVELDTLVSDFQPYLESISWKDNVVACSNHSSDHDAFSQRFFTWFDAFKVMKALHWLRDNAGYAQRDPLAATNNMRSIYGLPEFTSYAQALKHFRKEDAMRDGRKQLTE